MVQAVKNPPEMWETTAQSLDQENPLEKGMATTLVLLPGEFHGQRSLVIYSPWGLKKSDTIEQQHFHFTFMLAFTFHIGSSCFCMLAEI